ncbi:DNA replication/repair protein RecF [Rickettsiales bacterium LUAb2]
MHLYNFRNYTSANVNLEPFTILVGNNGSGKTNFLEAISLLSPGKGLRSANLNDLINNSTQDTDFAVNVKMLTKFSSNNIQIKSVTDKLTNSVKKTYFLDNEPLTKQSILAEYAKPLWITPKMDTFFLEDNTSIRKFFDRLVFNFDPNHLTRLNAYNKTIKERNKLLKTGNINSSWLNALEEIIAENGVAIAATRLEFINKLNHIIQTNEQNFCNININVENSVENFLVTNSALTTENYFKDQLLQARKTDFLSGVTTFGIHKTTFNVINISKNANAKLCSTGEQKLILITIILALTDLLLLSENNPILLLDELLVHLDENIRNKLLARLLNMKIQCLITSTDLDVFGNYTNNFKILTVNDNVIQG